MLKLLLLFQVEEYATYLGMDPLLDDSLLYISQIITKMLQ